MALPLTSRSCQPQLQGHLGRAGIPSVVSHLGWGFLRLQLGLFLSLSCIADQAPRLLLRRIQVEWKLRHGCEAHSPKTYAARAEIFLGEPFLKLATDCRRRGSVTGTERGAKVFAL